MTSVHLLNLRSLAGIDIDQFALLRFEGREALSEPFDYRLELVSPDPPGDVSVWIGKLAEWDITTKDDTERVFAGRIFETEVESHSDVEFRVHVRVRPAYIATAYARATHFIQDKDVKEIFEAITADVPGLVTDISFSPAPPKRTYAVRYDETEFDFLARLLAQDGIFYYFEYNAGAGTFHHRMRLANAASGYGDVPGGDDMLFQPGYAGSKLTALTRARRARVSKHDFHGIDPRKVDTPFLGNAEAAGDWGRVYAHSYEDLVGEALASGDVSQRGRAHAEGATQGAESISGSGRDTQFFAGGRIKPDWPGGGLPDQLVLTSVTHSAHDPWMIGGGTPTYGNTFTAMDAAKPYRPALPRDRRRAPGPVLGIVANKDKAAGEAVVDSFDRVPVSITHARDYSSATKPLPEIVWLPVQQAWASGTHGAQFFPRIGSRVVIDFLYGDPDMPFVSGAMYTPSAAYPFAPASKVTQTGWRSVSDKNGSITQELMFEDKPGAEEVYLYTGRDYRRVVDHDETGTVKHDQILTVEHDQTETVKHDQTITVEHDQTETVKHDQTLKVENNRAITVTGTLETTVQKTRTVKVTQKNLLESMQEIELKVGGSSIKITATGIEIKAAQITIKAEATLNVSAGAMAEYKAPMTQVSADATLILKGGVVMIN